MNEKGFKNKIYHGTGASFDKPEFSYRNAEKYGEGAQAYGLGLYAAEDESVSKYYQRKNSNKDDYQTRYTFINGTYKQDPDYEKDCLIAEAEMFGGFDNLMKYFEVQEETNPTAEISDADIPLKKAVKMAKKLKRMERFIFKLKESEGNLYELAHNLKDYEVIYYDINMDEQNIETIENIEELVQYLGMSDLEERKQTHSEGDSIENYIERLDPYAYKNYNAKRWLDTLYAYAGSQAEANKLLLDFGIKAIKYADGNTRNSSKKKYNYVFLEQHPKWKRKDFATYDDNGDLIPPSQRGNADIDDMRFKIEDEAESTEASEKDQKYRKANHLLKATFSKIKQSVLDAFHPLAILESVAAGKDVNQIDASESAWKMAQMTKNLEQVIYHVLHQGSIMYDSSTGEFKARKGSNGLAKILKVVAGKKYKNFENYAKARSAYERYQKKYKLETIADVDTFAGTNNEEFYKLNGFSLSQARKWMQEGTTASKNTFKNLQKFFKENVSLLEESGLISSKQSEILSSFHNYVPFFRKNVEKKDLSNTHPYDRYEKGTGLSGRKSGVQEFIGSTKEIENIVESIVKQTRAMYDNAYKNIAMKRSLNLMVKMGFAKYINQNSTTAQAKLGEMRQRLINQGYNVENMSNEEIQKMSPIEIYMDWNNKDQFVNDNIVSVRVNGKLAFYQVDDPSLLTAIKNFGMKQYNPLWKVLTAPKNLMTWGITKVPQFAIRNFIRDTSSNAILFGGKTLVPYVFHTAKNVGKLALKGDTKMANMWASGAGGGYWYAPKAGDVVLDFKDDVLSKTRKKIGKYTIAPISKLFDIYDKTVLNPSEMANRVSRYEQAKANGASDMEASYQAMDVLNFAMRGSGTYSGENVLAKGAANLIDAIIRITPFLNARIQGLYKLWRESGIDVGIDEQRADIGLKNRTETMVKHISKAILMRASLMAGASILYSLYANNSEDDDGEKWFEKLPAHDKLMYWHIYAGNNQIYRIPKPFEIGFIFGTIPEAMTDTFFQKNPETAKILWKGLADSLNVDPLSNPVFDTARELISGKDSFRETPIVEWSDKSLSPEFQYNQDTSATAKATARILQSLGVESIGASFLASPAHQQNLMNNFLGSMTRYITAVTDPIIESITDIEGGTSRYAREPLYRDVYSWATRNTKTMSVRQSNDFYELRENAREMYASARLLFQEQRFEQLENHIERNKAKLANLDYIEAVNSALSDISRQRKALTKREDLSSEQLMRLDDELIAERNRIFAYTDILLDRIERNEFKSSDFKEIQKRIENASKERKASPKTRKLMQELSNMR